MLRAILVGTALAVTALAAADAATSPGAGRAVGGAVGRVPASGRPVRYVAPLPAPLQVVRRFAPPDTPYGPGHLGVDLRAAPAELVASAGAGVVGFTGSVAGRGVVVVDHADGIRTEYEPVRPLVRAGVRVRAGQPIGVVHGRHKDCPGVCVHWGARRGGTYVDPLGLLRPLGPVVLLPWRPRPG